MKQNFHTHTWRCKHASGSDEEYVRSAIAGGYDTLGFSDHGPFIYDDDYVSPVRMAYSQIDEYFSSLNALKEKYKDEIAIHIGFEYEYLSNEIGFIRDMAAHPMVDYLIFGNHKDQDDRVGMYFGNAATKEEILRYEKNALEGMNTGVFKYLAHPDLFLCSYIEFDKTAQAVSRSICREAKALNMPLEYNLYGLVKIAEGVSGLGYPYNGFWEIAAQEGCEIVIGVDAHYPQMLSDEQLYADALQHILKCNSTEKSL